MAFTVASDLFEGPLPLLVELAKLNLLDVFLFQLRELTTQYLEAVKTGEASLNELAEPLPLLGQLVALKARLLLPQPLRLEDEEEVVSLEELQQRLREYEQFKTVAQLLAELHTLQHQHLTRTRPGLGEEGEHATEELTDAELPIGMARPAAREVGLVSLVSAFAKILEKADAPVYEVTTEPWTVEMKVEELTLLLTVKRQIGFQELFSPDKSRLELVGTFLALLELVRRRLCLAVQERVFGEILIVRREPPAGEVEGKTHGASGSQTDH